MISPQNLDQLIAGKMYRVRWKQQSGNYRWYVYEATWQFLETTDDAIIWSGRPLCGTQDMRIETFLGAIANDMAKPTLPKRIGPVEKNA